jgi:SNF2 family DNA or RNA helicase
MLMGLTLGTPVHNGLKDMFSLFRFLELPVYSAFNRFKGAFGTDGNDQAMRMQVILRSLMMRRKKDGKINGRPIIVLPEKVPHFKSHLTKRPSQKFALNSRRMSELCIRQLKSVQEWR